MSSYKDAAGRPDYAVLVMAYGGPDSLDDVEPYLLDIRGGRPTSPELVAEIRERYARIGGRSPLLAITRAQATELEKQLNAAGEGTFRAYVGMRHWHPYIQEAVSHIAADGIRDVVALVMAPHYSRMSIGAYRRKVEEAQAELAQPLRVRFVESWHDHPLFVTSAAEQVRSTLDRFPAEARDRVQIVFTAHSLPASIVAQGDPYDRQLRETAHLVAAALDLPASRWQFCYQSAAVGAAEWLGPAIEEVLVELIDQGHGDLIVAPIGFVADHVEVLYDIDVVCQEIATGRGARLERPPSQNASPMFVAALADVVRLTIEGER